MDRYQLKLGAWKSNSKVFQKRTRGNHFCPRNFLYSKDPSEYISQYSRFDTLPTKRISWLQQLQHLMTLMRYSFFLMPHLKEKNIQKHPITINKRNYDINWANDVANNYTAMHDVYSLDPLLKPFYFLYLINASFVADGSIRILCLPTN